MLYRVTQSQIASTAREYLAKQSSELFRTQQQISSGLKIQRPADDPAGMRRSLIQKDRVDRLESHVTSIKHVQSRLEQAHVQLREANTLLTRAREIAIQAPQTTDDSEVRVLVAELNGILEQLDSVANSSDESGYLFSGTAANNRPFPGSTTTTGQLNYSGAPQETQLLLTGELPRAALLPGDLVFQPVSREATIFIGRTGAGSGTGTDTATGTRELIVSHGVTTYAAGSGVTAGTTSATGDTIIGSAGTHRLQIVDTSGTGAFGTVSLNGGDPVSFTSSDTDLVLQGPDGEQVTINTSSITAGFSGSVDITASGTMSIDGGTTFTPISFVTNETVTDSRDGSVVHVDAQAITRTGTEQLEFPGTTDIFSAVRALRDDLLNTRGLETSAQTAAFSRRHADIDRIQTHVLDIVGMQSVSMEQIERLETRTEDLKLAEKIEYSDTVSADIGEAVLRLQELNNLQQFTMAAVSRLLTPSLLNYLR